MDNNYEEDSLNYGHNISSFLTPKIFLGRVLLNL